jgi:hypothetical protein
MAFTLGDKLLAIVTHTRRNLVHFNLMFTIVGAKSINFTTTTNMIGIHIIIVTSVCSHICEYV